ncbi:MULTISPECIES: 3-phosphoserine/phosphohydroxythreonine transaminase [Sphingobacterium]|jgi:phosphoserine aminotransferase|uniref:3-phosphoserine/phosphohydroxythreonine transaminase n=2 Tax=Sphingobacterium TaxID=28453 RepID=A0ACD5C5V7_9SPHI|nr:MULTISPECIES: 3-phosphoserine/phosphohydroxythreonine transaminase [Sphingobacterium]HAE68167.1 3-phosphoserine/phosphohydroxythreonine transaminase [Sphingobacterium sp.]OFV09878.1 3-phosphoserine/phosphohydroxythreonine aminotransferase [Sphingobacterium sp. HMSC13C05]OJZ07550.1 MAG: phosphoserine transaminase [Sphingobacterium sp. 40-24]QQT45183.1 3-phosphoserine/phosphohydroxythreonine transaminase [Sphingobacterium multivorum]QQT62179.1 3-phosphoserine/phosphohydroxythreonine transamin
MKHNFGAGPCILPKEVFQQASEAVIDFNNTGLSILEISHRSKEFEAVIDEATQLVRELLAVPQGYSILFLQGGASLQFAMAPLNLLPEGGKAAYLDTGVWATKALKEAKKFGTVDVVASSIDKNYSYIPKGYAIPTDAAYFHYTANNTIYGTEVFDKPETALPVVVDMSSDIFSREINVADYDLIYAGAQKNMGPAGVTLVIVKDDILGKSGRILPSMLDYQLHINGGSMYNTPPVYSIFVSMLNLRWLKAKGGVSVLEQENIIKARALYDEIDRNPLFKGTAAVEDRSRMNVTFVMDTPELEAEFLALAKERNLIGIKGHRSVGGFRASIYNALPLSSVNALIDAMKEFEDTHTA